MPKLIVILTAIILSSACSCKSVATKVLIPPKPDYPNISASELLCLDPEAYTKLVINDVTCKADNKKLRRLIDTHNQGVK